MSLAHQDIKHIAKLARIRVNDSELTETTNSFNTILNLVDALQKVDTALVTPLAHPLEGVQRLRSDQVTEYNQRARHHAIAPAVAEGLYLVPKVIE